MLSKENVDKLVKTGLYKHEPDTRYRDSIHWNDMYLVLTGLLEFAIVRMMILSIW